jgi:micrococcal nuclease
MGRGPGIGAVVVLVVGAWVLIQGCVGGEDDLGDRAAPAPGSSLRARVMRVVDGDTIVAAVDGERESVRYIGVDTPETVKPGTPVQCYGPRASAVNHRLVEGRTVRLVVDREARDDYGRLLAYVYTGSRFVNAELVRGGYARTLAIEPKHLARAAAPPPGGAGRPERPGPLGRLLIGPGLSHSPTGRAMSGELGALCAVNVPLGGVARGSGLPGPPALNAC